MSDKSDASRVSTTLIQQAPAWELSVEIRPGPYTGFNLRFVSRVPTARRPEPQVRFQANLSVEELTALHQALGRVLAEQTERALRAGRPSSSPSEPLLH